ncbi:tRNA (guanosine(37)-N1)-methyltransferase TrmD [Patescibacteria group bacterium]|nr:tRNA (guanosine(37)-N1)-methyltransferase TrmD [Patescibacteria group bacterium]MBU4353291.1 tRNA (guanosine(37)-N1)-methyltransferase TrmD [Patescibacteria group bacterium]MCG2699236.1 tRNA (guanosine(37)-N1)-methyltransferase TrmD [Candidatus Parcubacteria bacterium]
MVFHFITIFPESIKSYFDSSILKRAQEKKLIKIKFYNPRDYAKDKHKNVDDRPFGGGPGMVMKAEPIAKIIDSIARIWQKPAFLQYAHNGKVFQKAGFLPLKNVKIVLLSPAGKQFNQKMAREWAKKYKDIILISGHYEGVDERVKKIFKAEKISVGDYILTGGELPSALIIDAVSRHIPGVLGKEESLEETRQMGAPVYTRPEIFEFKGKKYRAPKVLLSGNHKKTEEWREKHSN